MIAEIERIRKVSRDKKEQDQFVKDECSEFNMWLDKVVEVMKRKFRQKAVNGFEGWDDPNDRAIIEMKLTEHVERELGFEILEVEETERERGQLVDIMNLVTFLFVMNLKESAFLKEKEDGKST